MILPQRFSLGETKKTSVLLTLGLVVVSGCATYSCAQKVKTIAFDDNIFKGQTIGPIRGEDCTWTVLRNQLGGQPTIDKASINAKNGGGSLASAGLRTLKNNDGSKAIRHTNNATTANESFNTSFFGKQYLVVTGAR